MLAPVIAMKRTLILLFALLALGTFALAASLPSSGTVTVTNDSGIQVGTGTIANGKLALSLASGTSGFVTITVTAADGSSQTYEAMVKAGGQVTVVDSGQLSDLSSFAKTGGVDSVDVSETTESQTPDNQTSQAGQPETPDSTAAGQEDASSQTGDASSGSSASSSGSGTASNASTDSSPDSSASQDNQTETETGSTSGDDQVKVGSNLSGGVSTHTGSDGTSTDTSGSVSTDD
jgi:hypothetical protein